MLNFVIFFICTSYKIKTFFISHEQYKSVDIRLSLLGSIFLPGGHEHTAGEAQASHCGV